MIKSESNYELVLQQGRIQKEYFRDLIRFRELFYFFAWRDTLVRYKQAVFGILWALMRPIITMLLFSFVFGKLARLPSDQIPYPLFVLAGMLPWQFFSNSLSDTCLSLLNNGNLITKSYFPRIILPMSQVIVNLIDFAISGVLLTLATLYFGLFQWASLIFVPLITLHLLILSVGLGFWLSALTVKYRDFRILMVFFIQFGLFLSPVGYGSFNVPEQWQLLYFFNPVVGIIEVFRWAFFGIDHSYLLLSWGISFTISVLALISGFMYFRSMENRFADLI